MACLLGGLMSACGSSAGNAPAGAPEGEPPPTRFDPAMAVFVYACSDGFGFTVAVGKDGALIFLPAGPVLLPHVPSGSGARYANESTTFWSKGEEAMLLLAGVERRGCLSDRAAAIRESARLRGVDYRAVGNEPGWHLEITDEGFSRYVGDYGATVIEFPTPRPGSPRNDGERTYIWSDGVSRIAVSLLPEPCQDTMADLDYPWTASIDVNGRVLNGCAWALSKGPH